MFKIGDKVKVVRAGSFFGDKVEWDKVEIIDDQCDNLSFVFHRPPNLTYGLIGRVTNTIDSDDTIGYVVDFDGVEVAVPTYYLSDNLVGLVDSVEPTTKMEVHKSTYEFLVEKFGDDQEGMVNYITELVSNNIPEPQKKSYDLNPEVFRELAQKLSEVENYHTQNIRWSSFDTPIDVISKNMPIEYEWFFGEMFGPETGERNYWWDSQEWLWGNCTSGEIGEYIQTKVLPNPKSHFSQVIMALLFCAEMCED